MGRNLSILFNIRFKSKMNSLHLQLPLPSVLRVSRSVLAVLGHLHQLVDGVQQAVAVLPQQPLVEPLVSEAHFEQHRHQGRVLSGGRVNASLEGRDKG